MDSAIKDYFMCLNLFVIIHYNSNINNLIIDLIWIYISGYLFKLSFTTGTHKLIYVPEDSVFNPDKFKRHFDRQVCPNFGQS